MKELSDKEAAKTLPIVEQIVEYVGNVFGNEDLDSKDEKTICIGVAEVLLKEAYRDYKSELNVVMLFNELKQRGCSFWRYANGKGE